MNVKSISFLLTLVLLLTVFSACAKKEVNNKEKEPESEYADRLPDCNFGGEEVTMALYYDVITSSVLADDMNGDSVSNALYESRKSVETRFGIEIIPVTLATTMKSLDTTIGTQLLAGSSDYDILAGYQYYDTQMALKNLLLDLNDLSAYGADGLIDPNASYWAGDYIKAMNPGNRLYWLVGDISTMTLGTLYCTFVNLDLYNKYMFDKHGSIYDLVREKQYTLDMIARMGSEIYQDLDEKPGMSANDLVGFASHGGSLLDGLMIGAGLRPVRTYEDGTLEFNLNSKENVGIMTKVAEFKEDVNALKLTITGATTAESLLMQAFATGNILFTGSRLNSTEFLREMQNDYGVLPMPLYDENQTAYYTTSHDSLPIFGISASSEHVKASAYVLEALCAKSGKDVVPAYFDEALKYKYTRDDDSAEMIQIVHDSLVTDFSYAWSKSLLELTHTFRDINPNSVQSTLSKKYNAWQDAFDSLIVQLG